MIVTDVNIINNNLPIGKTVTWEKIKMFVEDAENEIKKVIGKTFYEEIVADSTTDTTMQTLKKKLQSSISYTSYWLGFEIINATFSNQGIHRIEDENSGKKALFQRQEENLKLTFKRTGQNKLDDALLFLEENKSDFPTWTASEQYTLLRRNFINSTEVFSSLYFINNSRLVFLKLRPSQIRAEDFEVVTVIGRPFFDELKTQIADDSLTSENEKFLKLLQKAVAPFTIFHGGYQLLVMFLEHNVLNIEDDVNSHNFKKKTQTTHFDKILADAKATGDNYMQTCEAFLKANISDYPTYENSDIYSDTVNSYDRAEGTDKIVII